RADAQVAVADVTFGEQLRDDELGGVNGDGEADPDAAAALAFDGRIDPDDFPVDIAERSAGIARIDGRVRLDHIGVEAPAAGRAEIENLLASVQAADDPDRERAFVAVGAADSDGPMADLDSIGVAQARG